MNQIRADKSASMGAPPSELLRQALDRIERLELAHARLVQFVPCSVRRMIESEDVEPEKRDADVTVLFLDVEGYTALSERLSARELDTLIERYFSGFIDAIEQQGGDINETAGDGLMVLFRDRDPVAHARHAARAALRIQRVSADLGRRLAPRLPPLAINIGISSGPVSIGPRRFAGRSLVRCTYTASGAVTNLAARLQAEAHGGAVLVSDETARRIAAEYELADLGLRKLRNFTSSLPVHRLIGPCGARSRGLAAAMR